MILSTITNLNSAVTPIIWTAAGGGLDGAVAGAICGALAGITTVALIRICSRPAQRDAGDVLGEFVIVGFSTLEGSVMGGTGRAMYAVGRDVLLLNSARNMTVSVATAITSGVILARQFRVFF